LLVPEVAGDGGLAVGADRDDLPALAGGERPAAEEGRDGVTAAVPARPRRHGHARVVGEHRDHGIDVVALPRIGEAFDELAELAVAELA
jgi:hypothetical protein